MASLTATGKATARVTARVVASWAMVGTAIAAQEAVEVVAVFRVLVDLIRHPFLIFSRTFLVILVEAEALLEDLVIEETT